MATTTNSNKPFTITRVFDAPRELVWETWTSREHLMQWFGPKGVTIPVAKLDLRPGGVFHYCMRTPDGKNMWGKWVFREIVAPERIVLVNSFSDEKGGITRHPMVPDWPLEMLSTSTFAAQGQKTALTLAWQPINASDAEWKVFNSGRDGMTAGWSGTFEQLDAYLAKAKQR